MSLSELHILNQYIDQYQLNQHLNADLLRCLRVFQFEDKHEVYTATTELSYLYFLVSGKAQVNYYLASGKRSVIAMIVPFTVLGDVELLENRPLQMNVQTTETSIFLGIRKADVLQYAYDDPQFLRFLLHHMSRKLRGNGYTRLSHDMPLINRVANYLMIQNRQDHVIIPESKTLIADLLSTTPRHLNRVIKTLEDDGIIKWQRRRIVVLDLEKLQSYGEL